MLGLGNIGALAGKPVMEGKAVLFKRFADIDVFDIELNAEDPDDLIRVLRALEPTFGGINLEDIKAPECFYIEEKLASGCRSRSSTTTSTARPSSPRPRSSTRSTSSASASMTCRSCVCGAGAAAHCAARSCT